MPQRRRRHTAAVGKKAVYITSYRNLAIEMRDMYAKKGFQTEIAAEHDSTGHPVFVVYIFP